MTYLTIDLDYWDQGDKKVEDLNLDEGIYFLKFLKLKFKDIKIVDYHHEIIDHIHSFLNVDRIINIDYHSDIANEPMKEGELNEGTWANFVNGRENMAFEWRMPNRKECLDEGYGRCDSFICTAPINKSIMGYNKIYFREGIQRINYDKVCGVSISKSPDWTHSLLSESL